MDTEPAVIGKTVFLLDCSSHFRNLPSGVTFEMDGSLMIRGEPPRPINKLLYTCTTEAIFEYCRIVWDLFPNAGHSIQLLSCLTNSVHAINGWDPSQQNLDYLFDALYRFSVNIKLRDLQEDHCTDPVGHMTKGFSAALESLSSKTYDPTRDEHHLANAGRIILLTNFASQTLVQTFRETIKQLYANYYSLAMEKRKNLHADSSDIIEHLQVIVVNAIPWPPPAESSQWEDTPTERLVDDRLTLSMFSALAGPPMSTKLTYLTFEHYNLAVTTVKGIPMKEENKKASGETTATTNSYDVEIVHSKLAHSKYYASCKSHWNDLVLVKASNSDRKMCPTLTLKWCTPKTNVVEINECIAAYRFTALDPNSRPSTCLINFLHTGKTVSLELPQSVTPVKIYSHMLQSHNGDLFIHVLPWSFTTTLIDTASDLTECVGGLVSDYRVNEFVDFMRQHRLVKVAEPGGLDRTCRSLYRHTKYWPLTTGMSVFFNTHEQTPAFYQLISQERLSDEDISELQKIIISLVGNDTKNLNLPMQSNLIRNKNLKKGDQFRILWNEMEHIIRCFSDTSQHNQVLKSFLNMLSRQSSTNDTNNVGAMFTNGNSERSLNGMSIDLDRIKVSSQSLHALFLSNLIEKSTKRRREFIGRCIEGKGPKLYKELNKNNDHE